MSLLVKTATKTFSVLSIGQRGVGKTVFLAGSYAELHPPAQRDGTRQLWFDCHNNQVKEDIEDILNYIRETGQYPPPTMKVTDFSFSLKRHTLWRNQTLCNFRWWDIPGELCNINNPNFRTMVLNSHGCCVFIDAYALIHKPTHSQDLEGIIQQVMPIANLVDMNSLRFPFALILTKCDLLEPNLLRRQHFQKYLQPLTNCLDSVKPKYRIFYSNIPIVSLKGTSILKAKGAAAPLIWLVWELSKVYKPGLINNLSKLISPLISHSQPQQDQVDGTLDHLLKPTDKTFRFIKILGRYWSPSRIQKVLRLTLIFFGLIGGVGFLVGIYGHMQHESNLDTSRRQAVSSVEKLVQEEPESIELRLQLAQLYESTDQVAKAETAYDHVLIRQKNNVKALIGKAVLRNDQGDLKTAKALFVQAEKAASTKLQAEEVRAVAQKTLPSFK